MAGEDLSSAIAQMMNMGDMTTSQVPPGYRIDANGNIVKSSRRRRRKMITISQDGANFVKSCIQIGAKMGHSGGRRSGGGFRFRRHR